MPMVVHARHTMLDSLCRRLHRHVVVSRDHHPVFLSIAFCCTVYVMLRRLEHLQRLTTAIHCQTCLITPCLSTQHILGMPWQASVISRHCSTPSSSSWSLPSSLLPALQQQWQQRLNRAEALSQQQSDRAQAHAAAQDATIAQLRAHADSLSQTVRTLDENLSTLKAQKASLGNTYGELQIERQSLLGEGQRLKGQVQQLEASVCSLRQELLQVLCLAVHS